MKRNSDGYQACFKVIQIVRRSEVMSWRAKYNMHLFGRRTMRLRDVAGPDLVADADSWNLSFMPYVFIMLRGLIIEIYDVTFVRLSVVTCQFTMQSIRAGATAL